jgi:outer membrane protein assembly factor BamB
MTIRAEINSRAQVLSACSVAVRPKMSHVAVAAIILLVTVSVVSGQALTANEFPNTIVLPGARSAEGIAIGEGSIFYASDFLAGDIFRGDLRTGKFERFIHPPTGRQAVGLKADIRHGLLFVAGGFTGQAYVCDLQTGTDLATFQLGGLINDVVVTKDAAWFTDSLLPHIYRIPIAPGGRPQTIVVTGPAANLSGFPNLNGIAVTPDGQTLIVSHSALGAIFTVDPTTGASKFINGVVVPAIDGIILEGSRVYAVQVDLNQIAQIDLSPDLSSGILTAVVTNPDFEAPTTLARFGDRLVAVNGKYDTGFPPTATTYEVVTVVRPDEFPVH